MNLMEVWKERRCDLVFTAVRMGKRDIVNCVNTSTPASSLKSRVAWLLRNAESNKKLGETLPLISIMAATTTRKVHNPSTKSLALFTYLLPSLIRTIDCGFRYQYVLGFDEGDPFYDSDQVGYRL